MNKIDIINKIDMVLIKEKSNVNKRKPISCPKCGATFPTWDPYTDSNKTLKCNKCGFTGSAKEWKGV